MQVVGFTGVKRYL